jgi:hypothetical protein
LPNSLSGTTAWADILGDSNFILATNLTTASVISATSSSLGTISYLSGGTIVVTNTASGGGTASIIAIGWNSAYATPQLAQANNSPVGWSAVFTYAYKAGPVPGPAGTPGNMNGLFQFGVAPVPEPATMALAGLGGLSLLLFRRRKV